MAWKESFERGITCFKGGNLSDALTYMNQAAELQSDNFTVYDSRAAVHEKLGNIKAALLDSKRVIELAPERWQGYARSARLFSTAKKYGSAIKMADYAVIRLRSGDTQRRSQILEIREEAIEAQAVAEKQRQSQLSKTSYLLGKLPVEILVEIFNTLVSDDHTWAIRLSQVCGHWRHILVDTPSLWRTLVLTHRHPLRKAKIWKQRSKDRISSISLSSSLSPLDSPSIISELKSLSWEHLSSLHISCASFIDLRGALSNSFISQISSKLNELSLLECSSPKQLQLCLSGPAWKLASLRLSGMVHLEDEWWQRIQQLTELHLCHSLTRFSASALEANPLLERLVFDLTTLTAIEDISTDLTPYRMLKLKGIELCNVANPLALLSSITAPSITAFHMSNASSRVDEALLELFHDELPSLIDLRIGNCGLDPRTLLVILSRAPCLENLQIRSVHGVVNEALQFLAGKNPFSDPQQTGIPCLSLKYVDVSRCSDLSTSSVYGLVKARLQSGLDPAETAGKCSVQSLKVDGCPNVDPEMLPWLRSKIAQFSCVYATKKELKRMR
ncbi:hypothetical protein HYDPIDRAFT_25350 [Hydnomerulius pinastri MD-312]|nr:hypothetical protein HYDPIDRAFT_25350 [Hydnomerulius pinastri MD-312]